MPRRSGPIEEHIRQLVAVYLRKYGHGTATRLAATIRRPSSWIGKFSQGQKQATVDEAVALARELGARPTLFVDVGRTEAVPAIDPVQADLEARWLRQLHRLQGNAKLLQIAFDVCDALARKRGTARPRRR